jgi:uncharacterized protein YndB with AHSA1/START domain
MVAPILIRVTRPFNVPPTRVFDAWLDPATVGKWLFATPHGVMKTVEIDARVGGGFVIAEQRETKLVEHRGRYEDIQRPVQLVFKFGTPPSLDAARVTVVIQTRETGCEVTLTHELDPAWNDHAGRTRSSWATILDRLAAHLG